MSPPSAHFATSEPYARRYAPFTADIGVQVDGLLLQDGTPFVAIELLLRAAGFTRWEVCSPFDGWRESRYPEPRPPQDGGVLMWSAWRD